MTRHTQIVPAMAAIMLALSPAACAQMQDAVSPKLTETRAMPAPPFSMNSIQPETTLDITAEASVNRAPDIAYITTGVQADRKSAVEAMAAQAEAMNGVFDALAKAGVEKKDMQTSGLSLNPQYNYVEVDEGNGRKRGEQRLVGYSASNQLTVKVRDLDNLGRTLDNLVASGGNTFSGLTFAIDDDTAIRDEARRQAMTDAIARAELYASAASMRVGRIVSISEGGSWSPQPMAKMSRMAMADESEPTPIAGGEVGYTANVSVKFELIK